MAGYIGAKVGTVTANAADIKGDISATDTTPEITLKNTTETDADGSRSGKITFKGEQSGGEESTLAQIVASHDTAVDDEAGDLIFKTNDGNDGASPTEAMRIDSSQNVGIGTSSPDTPLHIEDGDVTIGNSTATGDNKLIFKNTSATLAEIRAADTATGAGALLFTNNGSERMRIDSSGKVGIGTTTPTGNANTSAVVLEVSSTGANPPEILAGGQNAEISIAGGSGASYLWSTGAYPLVMATNATEHMRIASDGDVFIGGSYGTNIRGSNAQLQLYSAGDGEGLITATNDTYQAGRIHRSLQNGSSLHYIDYYENSVGTNVGKITHNNSATSYTTTSDYRLKENVVDLTGAITRIKQLEPKRFNFIADADTTVDGFLAHEAATVVPEAVDGAHNEIETWKEYEELPEGVSVGDNKLDDDGNTIPVYQGIDQAKLVPLLTAALQEAIAKIETLETKVAALEAE